MLLDEAWIADVGVGDSFLEPLQLEAAVETAQHASSYRLVPAGAGAGARTGAGAGDGRILERQRLGAAWEPQYVFALVPRRLEECGPMCQHHQMSPASIFTQKVVCSRATPEGRITLADGRWIETAGEEREERPVPDETELRELLRARFGIDLDPGAGVEKLLPPKSSGSV